MNAARPVVHLVDDDASLRAALGGLLVAAGYDVRAYASSAEFLLDDLSARGRKPVVRAA